MFIVIIVIACVYVGIIFDVLFNLHKFLRFEGRDPFQEKQKREDAFNNDWDRFAFVEYHRYCVVLCGCSSVDRLNFMCGCLFGWCVM